MLYSSCRSGAGNFFIDFPCSAMGGRPTGAGRTVVLASFLLGGPSGSGVATIISTFLIGLVSDKISFEPVLVAGSLIPLIGTIAVVTMVHGSRSS